LPTKLKMKMIKRKKILIAVIFVLIILFGYSLMSGFNKWEAMHIITVIDGCGDPVEVDIRTDMKESANIAENWIKAHSATYRERSDRGEIKLIEKNTRGEGEYEITFQFTTHDDGFGPPEEGEEVETGEFERVAKAIMYYDHISMLIIDNQWCDLGHREVTQEEIDNWARPRTEEETLQRAELNETPEIEGREVLRDDTREENGKTIRETEIRYEEEGEIVTQMDYIDAPVGEIESERVIRDIETNEIIREIEDWTETDEETGREISMRRLTVHEEGEYRISRVMRDEDTTVSETTTYDLETEEALEEILWETRSEEDKTIRVGTRLNLQTGEETVERRVLDPITGEVIEEETKE